MKFTDRAQCVQYLVVSAMNFLIQEINTIDMKAPTWGSLSRFLLLSVGVGILSEMRRRLVRMKCVYVCVCVVYIKGPFGSNEWRERLGLRCSPQALSKKNSHRVRV